MEVWIVEGLGDESPKKYNLGARETVGQLRTQFARQFGVSEREIELTTDYKKLNNDNDVVCKVVNAGETINIIPRAKAGM